METGVRNWCEAMERKVTWAIFFGAGGEINFIAGINFSVAKSFQKQGIAFVKRNAIFFKCVSFALKHQLLELSFKLIMGYCFLYQF